MTMLRLMFALTLVAAVATGCAPAPEPAADAPAVSGDTPMTETVVEETMTVEEPPASAEPVEAPAEEAMPAEEAPATTEETPAEEPTAALSPEDQAALSAVVAAWKEGMIAKDIEKATSQFSEAYADDNGDKAAAVAFFSSAVDMGYLDDLKVDEANVKYEVTGDTAIVGPFGLNNAMLDASADLHLKKEEAGWKITTTEIAM